MNDSSHQLTLYVDLDGTLTYTDLLFESALVLIKRNPLYLLLCLFWLRQGRARMKAEIANRIELDMSLLPYNETCLDYLRQQAAAGRRLVLASAANQRLARQVADHLGFFDAVLNCNSSVNLKSAVKLRLIQQDAAGQAFAYAGNSRADLAIWSQAREVILVNPSTALTREVNRLCTPSLVIPARPRSLGLIAQALRLHQWAKNLLLFIPLMMAHSLSSDKWFTCLLAFIAFGLCASATYVINDLFDLAADRIHPRKRARAFAAGRLSIAFGLGAAALLLPLSLWLAALTSLPFLGLLLLYLVATLSYSIWLKRVALVDVLILALLYTHRVLAGGVASDIEISSWLLAISLFMCLSLALVKRCAELEPIRDADHEPLAGRGYRDTDLPYLIPMGIASGFIAVMVLALFIDTQAGTAMYPSAWLLWLTLPVILFWIMRMWIKTSRKEIYDDPLLFAITDKASWIVALMIATIVAAASLRISL
ncbi:MAG: UbiA family prenyltransferase [Motiliproteus sp.]